MGKQSRQSIIAILAITIVFYLEIVSCHPAVESKESLSVPPSDTNATTNATTTGISNDLSGKANCKGLECVIDAYAKLGQFLKQEPNKPNKQRRWSGCGFKGAC